jgi:hypothetical protein
MTQAPGRQYVVLRVGNPSDEADFFGRVYGSRPQALSDGAQLVDTGRFLLRIERETAPEARTRGLRLEINVKDVNGFAEQVWNRGVKYARRPQNHGDGFRRVSFVSPGNVEVRGVGPMKADSTGAFPSLRPEAGSSARAEEES